MPLSQAELDELKAAVNTARIASNEAQAKAVETANAILGIEQQVNALEASPEQSDDHA